MKRTLATGIALILLAWGYGIVIDPTPSTASAPWMVRQEALYLTGLLSFSLMSAAMVLANRPAWIETLLGGMDRIYRMHKWMGIAAVFFGAAHWLVEMSDDVLKAFVGRSGRIPKEHGSGWFALMREFGEDLGEWAIYALLVLFVITLWKRFPYHLWRYLHRVMPVLYLMLVVHAVFLAPVQYWRQPAGLLLALLAVVGVLAAVRSLTGSIGQGGKVHGVIDALRSPGNGITEVTCLVPAGWKKHRPGQFAFVTFDRFEGAHPFTIVGVDHAARKITFQIKALGDYTKTLAAHLRRGQPVQIEGPYGRFDFRRASSRKRQIWVAGGIGVTPFLAWLESLQNTPETAPDVDLYYSVRRSDGDPFVDRLKALCEKLPSIRLHIRSTDRDGVMAPHDLDQDRRPLRQAEIWFCGPKAFGDALRKGLRGARFHQEAFEMR